MSTSKQNIRESILNRMQLGEITASEANVEMVRAERVRVVVNKLPLEVRKALNEAVKNGLLGRMKKDGMKPEAYYHINFEHLAKAERSREERKKIDALKRICI